MCSSSFVGYCTYRIQENNKKRSQLYRTWIRGHKYLFFKHIWPIEVLRNELKVFDASAVCMYLLNPGKMTKRVVNCIDPAVLVGSKVFY
jgi:hypothetical protein